MIEYMRKLSLKPVLNSDWNVEEFKYILVLIARTYFRRLLQHWDSRSKRRGQSNMLGRGPYADWCYYNPITQMWMSGCKYQMLPDSPRPFCPATYPTGSHHDVQIPRGKKRWG